MSGKHEIPKEIHLYYVLSGGVGWLTTHTSRSLDGCGGYQWLTSAPINFGDVVFNEKELVLKALTAELGVAQGNVNEIKDKIQQLLAIGHDEPIPPTTFDDDTPF